MMEVFEAEFRQMEEALRRLRHDSSAKAVFLIDKNGQHIAAAGETTPAPKLSS
jgi:C4-dicarboxylate-specific signal transduction histidine kinase